MIITSDDGDNNVFNYNTRKNIIVITLHRDNAMIYVLLNHNQSNKEHIMDITYQ